MDAVSEEFDPSAQDLTPAQHLARARFLAAVFESRSAALAGEEVHPMHLTEMRLYVEAARMHIELAREIDRQTPRPTAGDVVELAVAKHAYDTTRVIAEEVEELPEILVDHPTHGRIKWSWAEARWLHPHEYEGEQERRDDSKGIYVR